MAGRYDSLFTPMKIGKTEIKNRIVMCAMGGPHFINLDGTFSEKSATYLIERAKGGTGLIIPGITPVVDMFGAGTWFHDHRDAFIVPARRMMDKIHLQGDRQSVAVNHYYFKDREFGYQLTSRSAAMRPMESESI